ncbi:MAG: methyltransferase [Gammaproteobacteria bacterium]|jgi:predicted RNA methylase|nr:methyltransferase [Gammaproteobacteria bacterium]MDP6616253.1 methyltransferase [Gammaproteobacteria bacterium]MDP6695440.1 methyltransferase [Gammaproteobacteria bacterium]
MNIRNILLVCAGLVIGAVMVQFNIFPVSALKSALKPSAPPVQANNAPRFTGETVAPQVDQSIPGDTSQQGLITEPLLWKSKHLQAAINVPVGVFHPHEGEWTMGPIMENNAELFKGKRVMEIGTGSGLISLIAAKHGAVKVVATDINPAAIESVTMNAEALGYGDIVEGRLVGPEDMSAYAVINDDEQFDVILSNPPFALDLDAPGNDAVTDTGELGFSIVRGLKKHLASNGTVILLYDSLFYHQVMVKYAEYMGYDVRNNNPNGMYGWAAEALFNSYLQRLLESEKVPQDAFSFNYHTDEALEIRYLRNFALNPKQINYQPLFDPPSRQRYYAGFIVIRN